MSAGWRRSDTRTTATYRYRGEILGVVSIGDVSETTTTTPPSSGGVLHEHPASVLTTNQAASHGVTAPSRESPTKIEMESGRAGKSRGDVSETARRTRDRDDEDTTSSRHNASLVVVASQSDTRTTTDDPSWSHGFSPNEGNT